MGMTCFVIMPIGEMIYDGITITEAEFKSHYEDLIKEALLSAEPTLEIIRADEVAIPGTITSDIITRLMHSDLVVADITYPNPNVFYELGLRHATKPGTLIVRDKSGPRIPFDISQLRCIEYENSATGLKKLSEQLKPFLEHYKRDSSRPDSQFLELAKITKYQYPYSQIEQVQEDAEIDMILSVMQSPKIFELMMRQSQGEPVDQREILMEFANNPDAAKSLLMAMKAGGKNLLGDEESSSTGKKTTRKRRKR